MSSQTERPLLPELETLPPALAELRRWVGFRLVPDAVRPEKINKPPYSTRDGSSIGATPVGKEGQDYSRHWQTASDAINGAREHGLDGIGFVFNTPYGQEGEVGIDFDQVVVDGEIIVEVKNWLKFFPSYTEYSVSGSGVHVVCRGTISRSLTATQLPGGVGTVEVYCRDRYFTVTGNRIGGCVETRACQGGIERLLGSLGVSLEAPRSEALGPISKSKAIKIHEDNLKALRDAVHGQGNALCNTACFWAGKCAAAEVLDDSALGVIRSIVTEEWTSPVSARTFDTNWSHGWDDGKQEPLTIREGNDVERKTAEFNAKYSVIQNYGGKCRVVWFEKDTHPDFKGRRHLVNQSYEEFNKAHNDRVEVVEDGETVEKRFVPIWFYAENLREEYEEVVFEPEQQTPGKLNLWQSWAVTPKRGDCSFYLDHLKNVICSKNEEHYLHMIRWMAYAVRNPNERGHSALVWRGSKGAGKNLAMDGFGKLWGQHYIVITNAEHFLGRFNHHLRDCSVLCANEAFFAGNHQHEHALRGLVSDPMMSVEQKFVDLKMCPNLLHVVIISNADWVVPHTPDERRFFMVDVSEEKIGNKEYFKELARQVKEPNPAFLWHLLNEVDMGDFKPQFVPQTDAIRSQMEESLTGVEEVWFECLKNGEIPGDVKNDGTVQMRGSRLVKWAREQHRPGWDRISTIKVGLLLGQNRRGKNKGMGFTKGLDNTSTLVERHQVWNIPTLCQARVEWDKRRWKADWETVTVRWEEV